MKAENEGIGTVIVARVVAYVLALWVNTRFGMHMSVVLTHSTMQHRGKQKRHFMRGEGATSSDKGDCYDREWHLIGGLVARLGVRSY